MVHIRPSVGYRIDLARFLRNGQHPKGCLIDRILCCLFIIYGNNLAESGYLKDRTEKQAHIISLAVFIILCHLFEWFDFSLHRVLQYLEARWDNTLEIPDKASLVMNILNDVGELRVQIRHQLEGQRRLICHLLKFPEILLLLGWEVYWEWPKLTVLYPIDDLHTFLEIKVADVCALVTNKTRCSERTLALQG